MAGHLTGELGIGQAVRGHVRALEQAGVSCSLMDVLIGGSRRNDETYSDFFMHDAPYNLSLIEVNAEVLPIFQRQHPSFLSGKYCIGHWAWEQQSFPRAWMDRFRSIDEVWVASSYVAEGLVRVAPVPVLTMPYAVDPPRRVLYSRRHFRLPEDRFIFLFVFDFFSVFERKNPLGLIEAFRRAFQGQDSVLLVLKFSNAEGFPAERAQLYDAAARHPSVRLIDGYLSGQEVQDLTACCDAYVSLHRSEGFGLTLAEAMVHGKPVIGTDYSGSRDYLSERTGFPVAFRLVELPATYGPFEAGTVWAEPDIDDAARVMRFVFEHPDETAARGAEGAAFIRDHFSPAVIGERMKKRLLRIQEYIGA